MSSCRYTAQINHVRLLSSNVRELTLRLVEPEQEALNFLPGQAIAVETPSIDGSAPTLRYYSLASPPSQSKDFILLVSSADQGSGSTYLFQQPMGAKIHMHGPNGAFHLHQDEGRGILFIATGTGIAPFRSMLYTLLEKPPENPVKLLWGLRSERDLYYQEELQDLAEQHACFSFVTTLSNAHATWTGATGRVTQLVSRLPSVQDLAVYVCGHQKMVHDVTEIVRKKGHCPIYQEEFLAKGKSENV